jgi:hypothetical protein
MPGLAPCDNFDDTRLMVSLGAFSANYPASKSSSRVRHPK